MTLESPRLRKKITRCVCGHRRDQHTSLPDPAPCMAWDTATGKRCTCTDFELKVVE